MFSDVTLSVIMSIIIMQSVVMLSVVTASVVADVCAVSRRQRRQLLDITISAQNRIVTTGDATLGTTTLGLTTLGATTKRSHSA